MGNIACLMAAERLSGEVTKRRIAANAIEHTAKITSALPAGFLVAIKKTPTNTSMARKRKKNPLLKDIFSVLSASSFVILKA